MGLGSCYVVGQSQGAYTVRIASVIMLWLLMLTATNPLSASEPITNFAKAKLRGDQIGIGRLSNVVAGENETETTRWIFLDRLMLAESAGRQYAKNPRSSAFGPFQFIKSTWLAMMRKHFPDQLTKVGRAKALALRSDFKLARKMADLYTSENAATLRSAGLEPNYTNLRLAYLVGAQGAVSILAAKPTANVALLLGGNAVGANPFMRGMTARQLVARSARDLRLRPGAWLSDAARKKIRLPARGRRQGPQFRIPCKLTLPSCRKWVALKRARLARGRRYSMQ